VMYVIVPYNKVLFSVLYFFTCQSELDFGIAYVVCLVHFGKHYKNVYFFKHNEFNIQCVSG
jgi:hypothetical protein